MMRKILKQLVSLALCLLVIMSAVASVGIINSNASTTLIWPLPNFTMSQSYSSAHPAIDIGGGTQSAQSAGNPVLATIDGTVKYMYFCTTQHFGSNGDCYGYGTGIIILGDDGRWYGYAHMQAGSTSHLSVGSRVTAGQQIGKVGTTGNSSGPHLHFYISTYNAWNGDVNPANETYVSSVTPAPGSFKVTGLNKTYPIGSSVELNWSTSSNASKYIVVCNKYTPEGKYEKQFLSKTYTGNTATLNIKEIGKYVGTITPYNSSGVAGTPVNFSFDTYKQGKYSDLGDDFYAYITSTKESKLNIYQTADTHNVKLCKTNDDNATKQIWHFVKVMKDDKPAYKISNSYSGLYLSFEGTADGSNVLTDIKENFHYFYFLKVSGGYNIVLRSNEQKCLDITGGIDQPNTNIQVWYRNSSEAQRFAIDKCKVTVVYHSNGADNMSGTKIDPTKDVIRDTKGSLSYDKTDSNGLTNYSNTNNAFYLTKTGYTPTKYYADATGKYKIHQDDPFTGAELAKAFGKDLTKGNVTIDVYPQWKENTLTVNYFSNYATSTSTNEGVGKNAVYYTDTFKYSKEYTNGLTNYTSSENNAYASKTGYSTTGYWNTKPDGSGVSISQAKAFSTGQALAKYVGLDLSSKSATINLYPEWKANTYTVTFNPNGGNVPSTSKTVTYNSTYGTLPTPTRSGYTFSGWSTNVSGGSTVSSATKVTTTNNQTLYAKWVSDGHTHSLSVTNTIPASCTEYGVITKSCSCGYEESTTTAPIGHKIVTFAGEEATCIRYGMTAYQMCETCGMMISDPKMIDLSSHKSIQTKKENITKATCIIDGQYDNVTYCTDCGTELDRETIEIASEGHSIQYVSKDGSIYAICSKCGMNEKIGNIEPENSCKNAKINVASAKTVDYKSIVTIKATANDVPSNYYLAIYVNGKQVAKGSNTEVTYDAGQVTSDISYTVKVTDANGNVQKDANGNELSKDSKVICNAGFFKKLVAFFKGLFGMLPKVTIKP